PAVRWQRPVRHRRPRRGAKLPAPLRGRAGHLDERRPPRRRAVALAARAELALQVVRSLAIPVRNGPKPLHLGTGPSLDVAGELVASQVTRLGHADARVTVAQPPPDLALAIRCGIQHQPRAIAQLKPLRLVSTQRRPAHSLLHVRVPFPPAATGVLRSGPKDSR